MTPEEQYKILDMMKVYAAYWAERELARKDKNNTMMNLYGDRAELQYHEMWYYLSNIVNRNK